MTSLKYDLPDKLRNKMKIETIRIYFICMRVYLNISMLFPLLMCLISLINRVKTNNWDFKLLNIKDMMNQSQSQHSFHLNNRTTSNSNHNISPQMIPNVPSVPNVNVIFMTFLMTASESWGCHGWFQVRISFVEFAMAMTKFFSFVLLFFSFFFSSFRKYFHLNQ